MKAIYESTITDKDDAIKRYIENSSGKSNLVARQVARDTIGKEVYWNWDCRQSASY